jgi:hypothetical protein
MLGHVQDVKTTAARTGQIEYGDDMNVVPVLECLEL